MIYYERIQGIVIDTRYLMNNYTGKAMEGKSTLAKRIEKVINREPSVYIRIGCLGNIK